MSRRREGDQEITPRPTRGRGAFLKKTGGQMWIAHDLIGFSKLRKSPEFYE